MTAMTGITGLVLVLIRILQKTKNGTAHDVMLDVLRKRRTEEKAPNLSKRNVRKFVEFRICRILD